jgi:hypothetical protein
MVAERGFRAYRVMSAMLIAKVALPEIEEMIVVQKA